MSARDRFVPQTDPRADYLEHQRDIDAAISRVLARGRYILGDECLAFEREFAEFLGVRDVIGVGSGTEAITLALLASGIGPGDAVITVSHTAVATVAAIELAGAEPILVDIEPDTLTIDPNGVEAALTRTAPGRHRRIRAILPVHLYGAAADLTALGQLAERYGVLLIEDCAQAHGARLGRRRLGSIGDLSAFSFYPTKNLSAIGDGGAIATNRVELAERARLLRQYGWRDRYVSAMPGANSRLDELQAGILRVKLRSLDEANQRRQALAAVYHHSLEGSTFALPVSRPESSHVFHQYVVRTEARDDLQAWLRQRGIDTLVHYPVPVHRQPAYRSRLATVGDLPVTDVAARQVLSLPMYPQLPLETARRIVQELLVWTDTRR